MSNIKRFLVNLTDLTPDGNVLNAKLSWAYEHSDDVAEMEVVVNMWVMEAVRKYFPKAVLQEICGEWNEKPVEIIHLSIDDSRAYPDAPDFPIGLYASEGSDPETVKKYYGQMKFQYVFREAFGGSRIPKLQHLAKDLWKSPLA